jgi:dTMP kinase
MRLTRALILQSLMTTNRLEFAKMLQSYQVANRFLFLDRYYGSGFVYGEADGLDFEYLLKIHWTLPAPALWILVDIPAEESARRRPERRDEYEKREGFMAKVREGYLRLFRERSKNLPGTWKVIDGIGTQEEVHERILNAAISAGIFPATEGR